MKVSRKWGGRVELRCNWFYTTINFPLVPSSNRKSGFPRYGLPTIFPIRLSVTVVVDAQWSNQIGIIPIEQVNCSGLSYCPSRRMRDVMLRNCIICMLSPLSPYICQPIPCLSRHRRALTGNVPQISVSAVFYPKDLVSRIDLPRFNNYWFVMVILGQNGNNPEKIYWHILTC